MAIYRGPGGAGDATGDATNASALALAAADLAEGYADAASASAAAALASSEASINLVETLQADATTLSVGSSATASYDSGSTTITFGIPTGATGATGDAGPGVPTGGSTGQYLKKDSGTDFDTSWADVDALPSQTGNGGKYLTTDGIDPSWATLNTDANSTTKGLYEMSATISANYSVTSGNNAVSAGPITVDSGVTVTVPSGSVWTIV